MTRVTKNSAFFHDLRTRVDENRTEVIATFQPLTDAQLNWTPSPKEWDILQCFDHLNLTHDYYAPKITAALANPAAGDDAYKPSFWGRIYMFFAFNPRFSFPAADALTPAQQPTRAVLDGYLTRLAALTSMLGRAEQVNLKATRVPIERSVRFNLGDCLKVVIYHDELHINQAQRALTNEPTGNE